MPANDQGSAYPRRRDLATAAARPEMDRERRIELLVQRLPSSLQPHMRWLRRPNARPARLAAGTLLTVGGVLSILPVLGLWMLPVGLVLLSEDVKPLRRGTDRMLNWIERRRPHWLGLAYSRER